MGHRVKPGDDTQCISLRGAGVRQRRPFRASKGMVLRRDLEPFPNEPGRTQRVLSDVVLGLDPRTQPVMHPRPARVESERNGSPGQAR